MKRIKFRDLILFEDEDLMVLNKPPMISSLDDRSSNNSILEWAREYTRHAQLCHRLDKETSGCLILSKNEESYRYISILFQKRKIDKVYHAISEGVHGFNKKVVEVPIFIGSSGNSKIDFKTGKPSITKLDTLKRYRSYTYIEARPITGRLHQIRVHLSYLKAPICGDQKYGGHPFYLSSIKAGFKLGKWEEEQPLIKRLALHSRAISFKGTQGNEIHVEAPLPKDFRALLHQLDRYG